MNVGSSPGQIRDCIVVFTGAGGTYFNNNLAGVDNPYANLQGSQNPYFRTGDTSLPSALDPGGAGQFTGDTATTWDIQLSALSTFLQGGQLVLMFNHNQTNSGASVDQNLAIWAQIALVDNQGVLPTLYFYVTSVPNSTGLQNFGQPGGDPLAYLGPQTPATNTYPTGSDATGFPVGGVGTGTGSGDARFFVTARGQVCLNGPVGTGTPVPCDGSGGAVVAIVNDNLGANEVANAVIFPEIQTFLNTVGFGGYDVLQADIRMGCNAITITGGVCPAGFELNNGYEQAFLVNAQASNPPPPTALPQPASAALIGLGLLAMGYMLQRRRVN